MRVPHSTRRETTPGPPSTTPLAEHGGPRVNPEHLTGALSGLGQRGRVSMSEVGCAFETSSSSSSTSISRKFRSASAPSTFDRVLRHYRQLADSISSFPPERVLYGWNRSGSRGHDVLITLARRSPRHPHREPILVLSSSCSGGVEIDLTLSVEHPGSRIRLAPKGCRRFRLKAWRISATVRFALSVVAFA